MPGAVQAYFCAQSVPLGIQIQAMQIQEIINIDPQILGGTPVFTGTRVPIKHLFDYLEGGHTIEEFLDDFDGVRRDQAILLLRYALKISLTSADVFHENLA